MCSWCGRLVLGSVLVVARKGGEEGRSWTADLVGAGGADKLKSFSARGRVSGFPSSGWEEGNRSEEENGASCNCSREEGRPPPLNQIKASTRSPATRYTRSATSEDICVRFGGRCLPGTAFLVVSDS